MAVDYPGSIDMMLPTSYSFNFDTPAYIVVHETGGDMTLNDVYNTFFATMRSTHFAVARDGSIAQFVPLDRGAGGNCCPDQDSSGNYLCQPYWIPLVQKYGNLNLCTISIEHCNDSTNSLPLTQAQTDASNKLILWLLKKFNMPIDTSHVKGHNTINPIKKPNCPGTFDFNQLEIFLKSQGGGSQVTNTALSQQFDDVWFSGGSYCGETGIKAIVKEACLAGKLPAVFPLQHTGPNANSHGELKTVTLWTTAPVLKQCLSNGDYVEYTPQETRIYSNRSIRIL